GAWRRAGRVRLGVWMLVVLGLMGEAVWVKRVVARSNDEYETALKLLMQPDDELEARCNVLADKYALPEEVERDLNVKLVVNSSGTSKYGDTLVAFTYAGFPGTSSTFYLAFRDGHLTHFG